MRLAPFPGTERTRSQHGREHTKHNRGTPGSRLTGPRVDVFLSRLACNGGKHCSHTTNAHTGCLLHVANHGATSTRGFAAAEGRLADSRDFLVVSVAVYLPSSLVRRLRPWRVLSCPVSRDEEEGLQPRRIATQYERSSCFPRRTVVFRRLYLSARGSATRFRVLSLCEAAPPQLSRNV